MRLFLLLVFTAAACAGDIPLCCGRGGKPQTERSTVPLELRATPAAGDVLLALSSPARGPVGAKLEAALAAVPGVVRVTAEPRWPIARVWVQPGTVPDVGALCAAAREAGQPAAPALLARARFGDAGEKGRVQSAGRALASIPGVVSLEIEVESEEALARVWHRPAAGAVDIVGALATAGVNATFVP